MISCIEVPFWMGILSMLIVGVALLAIGHYFKNEYLMLLAFPFNIFGLLGLAVLIVETIRPYLPCVKVV